MGNFTQKSLLYLYNELSAEEVGNFQLHIFANAQKEAEFYAIKEAKEWIDRYLLPVSPSQKSVERILAFAVKK